MKLKGAIPLLLALLGVAGNSLPVAAQRQPLNPGEARRKTILYMPHRFAGAWNLNIAESKLMPGSRPLHVTMEIEEIKDGFRCVSDTMDIEGKTHQQVWTAIPEGSSSSNPASADGIRMKRKPSNSSDAAGWIANERWLLSGDGKTLTIIEEGKTPSNQEIHNSLVYEKR